MDSVLSRPGLSTAATTRTIFSVGGDDSLRNTMTAKPEAAADATSTAHSTPAGVSHTLDSELTSAGYGRQFEVVQEELAAHLITASAVMRRGLPAPMMIVCASVIFILMIVCVGEINIPDPQIRQVQMHQVVSKENNISDLDVGEFTGTDTGMVGDFGKVRLVCGESRSETREPLASMRERLGIAIHTKDTGSRLQQKFRMAASTKSFVDDEFTGVGRHHINNLFGEDRKVVVFRRKRFGRRGRQPASSGLGVRKGKTLCRPGRRVL